LVAALIVCNQIRSHGVWFGKRAVVGAVRVFEPTLGYVFYFRHDESGQDFRIDQDYSLF
jgi:hypothetical protein